jgi:hypothetical protein
MLPNGFGERSAHADADGHAMHCFRLPIGGPLDEQGS